MDVCVVTFNRSRYLRKCLDSLLPTLGPDRCLVFDNASFDDTPQVLAGYGDQIRVVRAGVNLGLAGGRNEVFRISQEERPGGFVAFSDDDYLFHAGWQGVCLEALQDLAVGVATPHNDGRRGATVLRQVLHRPFVWHRYRTGTTTSVCVVRAAAFTAAGGYPENGHVMGWVSTPFCARIRAAGFEVVTILADGGPWVENMDRPGHPLSERAYYTATGYESFRAAAKRGVISVGDSLEQHFTKGG